VNVMNEEPNEANVVNEANEANDAWMKERQTEQR